MKISFKLLLIIFSFFVEKKLTAQKTQNADEVLALRKKAEESIILLHSQGGLIPIQRLDTVKIASVAVGGKAEHFQQMAAKYTQIDAFRIENITDKIAASKLHKQLTSYNLIIVSISNNKKNQSKQIDVANIYKLATNKKIILTVFDQTNTLNQFDTAGMPAALFAVHENTKLHEEIAAQIIFGGIGAQGKLSRDINSTFKEGDGIITQPNGRFKYTIPEEVGLDADYIQRRIDAICQKAIDSGAFPGCQVLIVKGNKQIFHQSYGYHTYERKQTVKNTDIYDYASITKITAALPAFMRLHSQGKFSLEAPLKEYLPSFKNSNKENLVIRYILAHQAKLQAWIPYWKNTKKKNGKFKTKTFKSKYSKKYPIQVSRSLYEHKKYKKKIYKAIKTSPLLDSTKYVYSGLFFYLAPEIITNISNEPFESYLKKHIYRPLGAYSITFNAYLHFPLSQIIPTEKDDFFRMELLHGFVHDEGAAMMGGISSNAGLFSNANDLAKIMQMYMNGGKYGDAKIIDEATVKEFTRYQFREKGNRRGLGFDKPLLKNKEKGYISSQASNSSFGHSGYTGTCAWADPKYQLIFVFLSNRVYPSRNNRLIYQQNIRPRIHDVLYQAIKSVQ